MTLFWRLWITCDRLTSFFVHWKTKNKVVTYISFVFEPIIFNKRNMKTIFILLGGFWLIISKSILNNVIQLLLLVIFQCVLFFCSFRFIKIGWSHVLYTIFSGYRNQGWLNHTFLCEYSAPFWTAPSNYFRVFPLISHKLHWFPVISLYFPLIFLNFL